MESCAPEEDLEETTDVRGALANFGRVGFFSGVCRRMAKKKDRK